MNRPTVNRRTQRREAGPITLGKLLAATLLAAMPTGRADGQDTVYVWTDSDYQGYAKATGRVVDYTGEGLVLEVPGGSRRSFPAERIFRIDTYQTERQRDADALFAKREFDSADTFYRQARGVEKRPWVRRQITAQIVWCLRALGRTEAAAEQFLLLILNDAETPYFACIPLAWYASVPSGPLERAARGWLDRDEMPAAQLMGASHLTSTAARPLALARLRELAVANSPSIALLARAQTWRAEVVTVGAEKISAWQATIQRMPQPLRAGPYYVLGRGRAHQQAWEEAALAWMRVPILYPQHRFLAARSLVDAGRSLEKLGRLGDATRLYDEVMTDFSDTPSVAEARSLLEEVTRDAE